MGEDDSSRYVSRLEAKLDRLKGRGDHSLRITSSNMMHQLKAAREGYLITNGNHLAANGSGQQSGGATHMPSALCTSAVGSSSGSAQAVGAGPHGYNTANSDSNDTGDPFYIAPQEVNSGRLTSSVRDLKRWAYPEKQALNTEELCPLVNSDILGMNHKSDDAHMISEHNTDGRTGTPTLARNGPLLPGNENMHREPVVSRESSMDGETINPADTDSPRI